MMAQLSEVQRTTVVQEQAWEEKLLQAERKAKELKHASQSELREQHDRHVQALGDMERVHDSRLQASQEQVARLQAELEASNKEPGGSLN